MASKHERKAQELLEASGCWGQIEHYLLGIVVSELSISIKITESYTLPTISSPLLLILPFFNSDRTANNAAWLQVGRNPNHCHKCSFLLQEFKEDKVWKSPPLPGVSDMLRTSFQNLLDPAPWMPLNHLSHSRLCHGSSPERKGHILMR